MINLAKIDDNFNHYNLAVFVVIKDCLSLLIKQVIIKLQRRNYNENTHCNTWYDGKRC